MNNKKIAIIGMAGIFPNAINVDELWASLIEGQDLIHRNVSLYNNTFIAAYGKICDKYSFDNSFFAINNAEAKELDPQERKLLEVSYHALEVAGELNCDRSRAGIICGLNENEYALNQYYRNEKYNFESITNKLYNGSLAANRVAYKLNLQGPCFQVKATCATGIVALHQAINILRNNEADIMLVGTANISYKDDGYLYVDGGITSKDGCAKALARDASGCVPGDGVAVLVLKRLEDAESDNNIIHGIIVDSAVVNDGNQKIGFMAPSLKGEIAAMRNSLLYADIKSERIQYIETHGTGTKLGDQIEIRAIKTVYENNNKVYIGAIKNNIGHLNYSAGLAGVIKTVKVVEDGIIPPVININRVHEELENSNLSVNDELIKFPQEQVVYASVNSFGLGGVDTNLLLSSYRKKKKIVQNNTKVFLLPITAKSENSIRRYFPHLEEYVKSHKKELYDIAYTLWEKRPHYAYRAFWIVRIEQNELFIEKSNIIKAKIDNEYYIMEYNDLREVGETWQNGNKIKWDQIYENKGKIMDLPGYCFERSVFKTEDESKMFDLDLLINEIKEIEISEEEKLKLPSKDDFNSLGKIYNEFPIYAASHYWQSRGILPGKEYSIDYLLNTNKVISEYRYFAEFLLGILEKANICYRKKSKLIFNNFPKVSFREYVNYATSTCPEFRALFSFTANCVENYDKVFSGKIKGNSILYPAGSYNTILKVGEEIPDITRKEIYLATLPQILDLVIKYKNLNKKRIRVLEIGGGIGLLTFRLLEKLKEYDIEYYFSDIGRGFLVDAKRKAARLGIEQFNTIKLNIEEDFIEQGLYPNYFDFVIGFDVIQVAASIKNVFFRIKDVMKNDGVLALVQSFETSWMNYLSFGFAPGWWNYKQDNIRASKNIMPSEEDILNILKECQFKSSNTFSDSMNNHNKSVGIVLAAKGEKKLINNEKTHTSNMNSQLTVNRDIDIEKSIINIIEEVIGIRLNPDDDVFNSGIDSLSVLIVIAKIKEIFSVEVNVDYLYETGTITDIVSEVKRLKVKENSSQETNYSLSESNKADKDIKDLLENL